MGLISWFKSLFDKVGKFIKKAWNLASPFLKEVLSESANLALKALQDLAITAVQQVASQGLPTDEAKQKAFADYMKKAVKEKGIELKDSELNLLRETAVAIYKKAQGK
jgi:hypothetical protein